MSALKNHSKQNGNPVTGVSICIPRVFNNIGWRRIKKVFIDLRWGFVERVDVVPLGTFKRAFVHFAPGKWNLRDPSAREALMALQRGDEVKILYDDPWYWKIGLSHAAKPAEAPRPNPRPRVVLGSSSEKKVPSTPSPKKELTSPPKLKRVIRVRKPIQEPTKTDSDGEKKDALLECTHCHQDAVGKAAKCVWGSHGNRLR